LTGWTLRPQGPIQGELNLPGDKSITHRALIFNAFARGEATISGLLDSGDTRSTAHCLQALGAKVHWQGSHATVVGCAGVFNEPDVPLDCGNSGTTIRLLSGLLSTQSMLTILTGDDSLRSRPMRRIVEPLRLLGAEVDGRMNGARAPLVIRGRHLKGGHIHSPIASAQVKTAVLLAGLGCVDAIHFSEPHKSRDHSERMLEAMGVKIQVSKDGVQMNGRQPLQATSLHVPGDISSAAFFLVAASIVPNSDLMLRNVGLNPTRTGIIDVLKSMGADITIVAQRVNAGEPSGDVRVRSAPLRGTRISGAMIPRVIDELPVLSVAASFADGVTHVSDAAELRVKETDRIETTIEMIRAFGGEIQERPDGFLVHGQGLSQPGTVDPKGDHRIAMAAAIAGIASSGVTIQGADCVTVSFPSFPHLLNHACS